jgi:hypothetical protein
MKYPLIDADAACSIVSASTTLRRVTRAKYTEATMGYAIISHPHQGIPSSASTPKRETLRRNKRSPPTTATCTVLIKTSRGSRVDFLVHRRKRRGGKSE